jgi:hypothetical protein
MKTMRQSALSQPKTTRKSSDDVPRESVTRLIAMPYEEEDELGETPGEHAVGEAGVMDTRPTTPVPSFYRFVTPPPEDDAVANVLARRLEDLADDPFESRFAADDEDCEPFAPITRTRAVIPKRPESRKPPPIARGISAVLSSLAQVPYLRRTPLDISLATIGHRHALLLALINGRASIGELLDRSPMPAPEVLLILGELLDSQIIALSA